MCRSCPDGSAVGTRIGKRAIPVPRHRGKPRLCSVPAPGRGAHMRSPGWGARDRAFMTPRWRAAGNSLTKRQ
ncbi:hypothetical protein A8E25_08490 [Burkholderia cenocepacia]|nr:hypothetical protein BURCENK562V_C0597 [Burkholderia cenocepacia K56-2Valvano]ERI31059.1 hypothetical protein BURCENBC7_AP4652 [Burkholderia cenocepacia BC7]ONR66876.1 hypothetical protein A8E17_01870 [Burkholderia cenocepacia]ONR71019.1 hypothetical protein A8E23_16205 [Burkholderia cenocepacia]ONR74223.1 hypothetical protein A8E18_11165 [Burkholderia cenocepacia]